METLNSVNESSLKTWVHIGSGGFGKVYKVQHVEWRMNVAVKLLHTQDSTGCSLLREAKMMRQGGNPHVLGILGVYQSSGHNPGSSVELSGHGLVMEFMERGSLANLLQLLRKPPPLPLIFRLAHQIALGMNFLHCLSPPLLHLDLKPSNVLLDDNLKVKLTDFGLARFFSSPSTASTNSEEGGTLSYMPPEAFSLSYKPTQASDVYSYAIVLWSIITAEEPYPYARSTIVRFRVPEGDRPSLETVDPSKAKDLVDIIKLMKRCWHSDYKERPSFHDCLQVTEDLFENHKSGIKDAVDEVLKFLDMQETELSKCLNSLNISDPTQQNNADSIQTSKTPETSRRDLPQTQKNPGDSTATSKTFLAARSLSVDPRMASYQKIPPVDTASYSQSPNGPFQNCVSVPVVAPGYFKGISICMSNVTCVQIGNNNKMTINQRPRSRHPTAPPAVNQSTPKTSKT